MKGKKKYIVPLLLAGMTTASGIVTTINQQQQTIVNADTTVTSEITDIASLGMQMTGAFNTDGYKVNDLIEMPKVTVDGTADKIVYTIKRGSKVYWTKEFNYSDLSALGDNDNKFKPEKTGAYDVTIEAVESTGKVVAKIEDLKIKVSKTDASIVLPTNSKYVIPAQLPAYVQGETYNVTFKIPKPNVVLVDEDDKESDAVLNDTNKLVITLVDSKGEPTVLEEAKGGDPETGLGYYEVSKDLLKNAGTYQIRYEYKESDVTITSLTTNFQVVKKLNLDNIDLRMKLPTSDIPTTGDVNTDVKVPKVTALENKDSTDGINAHVVVEYKEENDNSWTEIEDYENYTFHPTKEGNYQLRYRVDLVELYGSDFASEYWYSEGGYSIVISDNQAPTQVRATVGYDVDTDGKISEGGTALTSENLDELLPETGYDVTTVAYMDATGVATVHLPAIYAEDNKSDYSKIKFTREIAPQSDTSAVTKYYYSYDKDQHYNADTDKNYYYEANESFDVKIKTAGNYTIRYKATDENGKSSKVTFNLVVKENQEDFEDSELKVTMNIAKTSVTSNEKLTFKKPTASDTYVEDKCINVETYYELWGDMIDGDCPTDGERSGEHLIANSKKVLTSKDLKEGYYSIKLADALEGVTNATYLRIVTVASRVNYDGVSTDAKEKWIKINSTDDVTPAEFKLLDTTNQSNPTAQDADATNWNKELLRLNKDIVATELGETTITNITTIGKDGYAETSSGDITINENKISAFNQGNNVITLPAVQFTDADENLKISVTIKDNDGNQVTKTKSEHFEQKWEDTTWKYTISGVQFRLSKSGMYTVTYRAEDVAGNVTIKTFGIRVNSTEKPTIIIENQDKFGQTIELGDWFDVPMGTVLQDDQELGEASWQVEGGSGVREGNKFKPTEVGTYYFTYSGENNFNIEGSLEDDTIYYINVEDTTAPVINDADDYYDQTMSWTDNMEDEQNATIEGQMKVKIPTLDTFTDPYTLDTGDVDVSISGPSGTVTKMEETDNEGNVLYYFVAKKQGKYTVTYVAKDKNNNSTEKKIVYALGDCDAPEVSWGNDYSVPTSFKLGDTFKLDVTNLEYSDEVSEKDDLEVSIKLIKPNSSSSATNEGDGADTFVWTLDETGTYKLQISVTDEAGNVCKMEDVYIEVESDDADEKTISPVVGTILIVVSVVILAGVVIYFVVSSKKKTPAKASKSRKK